MNTPANPRFLTPFVIRDWDRNDETVDRNERGNVVDPVG
jgi:hypothetical protein